MNVKYLIGKVIYNSLGIRMPNSYSKFNFGSRYIRAFCGKLILDYGGENVNIEKGYKSEQKAMSGETVSCKGSGWMPWNCVTQTLGQRSGSSYSRYCFERPRILPVLARLSAPRS